jgi:hypothetical protein
VYNGCGFYGSENWFVFLRKENILKMIQKRMMITKFGSKGMVDKNT